MCHRASGTKRPTLFLNDFDWLVIVSGSRIIGRCNESRPYCWMTEMRVDRQQGRGGNEGGPCNGTAVNMALGPPPDGDGPKPAGTNMVPSFITCLTF